MLPIGQKEMNRILEVADRLEISREAIQVELLPAGEGAVERLESGKVRIVLPEDETLEQFLSELERRLLKLRAAP